MQFKFEAIGTHWQIDIYQDIGKKEAEVLLGKIKDRIEIFDRAYSRFRADSLVTKMSEKAGKYVLLDDAKAMLSLYHDLFKLTEGKVTPLIGRLISEAGYDASYSLKEGGELRSPPSWDDVLEYNHPELLVKQPVLLDFGAAGKGYLVDIVGGIIEAAGIHDFLVDAGGDLLHRTSKSQEIRIGLENPNDFDQVIGVTKLSNKSLCASAGSRRKWGRFHHIIDPETLSSPTEILATWVMADSTLRADGLATALYFVSGNFLLEKYNFEYLVLYADFSIDKSSNFPGELFTINS